MRATRRAACRRRGAAGLAAIAAATIALSATASAAAPAPSATLSAAFQPERLGAPTSVSFGFTITSPDGAIPPALSAVSISYPAGLGLTTSDLGVASCQPLRLERSGPNACPANSRMGSGTARLRFQVGPQTFQEHASLALFAGPSPDGYLHLLILATGTQPVAARIVMSTVLDAGLLQITVPPVPSVPEGPDVAIVEVHATLGGPLTYYERRAGRTVAYHPRGIGLPQRCPHGGFPFGAELSFTDGTQASAHTAVRCPAH